MRKILLALALRLPRRARRRGTSAGLLGKSVLRRGKVLRDFVEVRQNIDRSDDAILALMADGGNR